MKKFPNEKHFFSHLNACSLVRWQLWNFILWQIRFNRSLHPNEYPKWVFWYVVRLFESMLSENDFSYTGISFHQNRNNEIIINQSQFSQNLSNFEYSKGLPDDKLNKTENHYLRRFAGQSNWLASQTRPDLAYDAFILSTCLNKATYADVKYSEKVRLKSLKENVNLKFWHFSETI